MARRIASGWTGQLRAACGLLLLLAVPPLSAGEVVTISVVTTNDFHGWIIGTEHDGKLMGGAHWLEGYLNVVREENPGRVIHLDAGDTWEGALISDYFDFEPAIEILNMMDVTAMAFANHELATGIESFQEVGRQLDFPLLAGNVFYRRGHRPRGQSWLVPPLKPYVIRKVQGVRVGLIGVLDPSAVAYFGPGSWVNQELYFADALRTAKRSLRKAERRGATLNILITHIGSTPDYQPEILEHLACNLSPNRLHLIVTGHLHAGVAEEVCGIPVVQSFDWGTAFSRVDFDVDRATRKVVDYRMNAQPTRVIQTQNGVPATYQRWDTDELVEVVPVPEIEVRVDYWSRLFAEAIDDVIGHTTSALYTDFRHEHAMGDWASDRMREALEYQVDFAVSRMTNAEIDAGDITLEEALSTFLFNNQLRIVELTGEEVAQVLNEGSIDERSLLQVSGLKFTLDYGFPSGSRVAVGDVFDADTDLPIDPAGIYQVVTTDYLANGAQNMVTLAANPQQGTEIYFRDYLIQWIRDNSPFTPPNPVDEQRITVLGTPPP